MKVTFEINDIEPKGGYTVEQIEKAIEDQEAYLDFLNNEIYLINDDGEEEVVATFSW